jgi:hypothetical protein
MPATASIVAVTLAAAGTGYQAYQTNQQIQHAKGAAQAEQTAMNAQIDTANKQTAADQTAKANTGSATQAAALAALRASMSASSGFGGSILTSPTGTTPAPIQGKTLLGA